MAVGTTWGVAKNARLVPVKFKNEGGARPAAIQDAFSWVINDVIEKDREGKAIINLSSGMHLEIRGSYLYIVVLIVRPLNRFRSYGWRLRY
jgi:hypothetical protein